VFVQNFVRMEDQSGRSSPLEKHLCPLDMDNWRRAKVLRNSGNNWFRHSGSWASMERSCRIDGWEFVYQAPDVMKLQLQVSKSELEW
jgi:hypothetical protein